MQPRYEKYYDDAGNILLIIEITYYTILVVYYVYKWIKTRRNRPPQRVKVRMERYEQRERRRIIEDHRKSAKMKLLQDDPRFSYQLAYEGPPQQHE